MREKSGEKVDVHSFGFSTKYHDREVGLIGYQKRFYSPDHGRWLNRDPIEDLRSAITSLFRKLRQTPLRLDGVLKWEKCECICGDTRWVRQSDIKESENVSFENIGINSAYSTDFRGAYKRLEKSLIRKLYDNLR